MSSNTPPPCYGKSWDPNDVLCKGGLNPTYKNPHDGSHLQPTCSWYQQCAQTTCAARTQAQAQVPAPVQSLLRPPTPPTQQVPATAWKPPMVAPPAPRPTNPFSAQVMQGTSYYGPQHTHQFAQVLAPPSLVQFGPQSVPMNYSAPGSQMPSYLTVPEPVIEQVPWYARLFHELFRAALKSSFHQGASFFDHNPLNKHPHE